MESPTSTYHAHRADKYMGITTLRYVMCVNVVQCVAKKAEDIQRTPNITM